MTTAAPSRIPAPYLFMPQERHVKKFLLSRFLAQLWLAHKALGKSAHDGRLTDFLLAGLDSYAAPATPHQMNFRRSVDGAC